MAAAVTVTGAVMAVTAGTSNGAYVPPQNPPADLAPSAAFTAACGITVPADGACMDAAVAEIDADRAAEGVGPITLPTGFSALSPAEQLFVITNLERVDRGLPPVAGLAANLDGYAAYGAATDTDPGFPPYTDGGGSLWSGGPNLWRAWQSWMYDDGYSSGGTSNEACTSPSAPLCWGHRDIILGQDPAPTLMGAAVSGAGAYGGSVAALLVGGDTVDAPSFTWGQVTADLPVGLSSTTLQPLASTGQSVTSDVEAWASGEAMDITAEVSGGDGEISVSPSSCALAPGQTCTLAVTFRTTDLSSMNAVLRVTGPNGPQFVALAGHPGYWQAASDGGLFSFGASGFYGSAGALALRRPIVGMAATADGGGYWLVAADGGVFSYGDAHFYGSAGALALRRPIVGMAATPDGGGYWLVAADGGVFTYGDAAFYGSAAAYPLRAPVIALAPS